MKQFLIDGGTLRVSPGVALRLTELQIKARTHALADIEDVSKRDGRAACISKQALEFKSGEIIGIEEADVAKPFRPFVVELDRMGKPVASKAKADADAKAKVDADAKAKEDADAKAAADEAKAKAEAEALANQGKA